LARPCNLLGPESRRCGLPWLEPGGRIREPAVEVGRKAGRFLVKNPLATHQSAPILVLLFTLACGKNEECTKARLEASDAWKTVTSQAGAARLNGWIGFEDLPEPKKAEHVRAFQEIEKQAEMVHSSFNYEKITWKTSDPARNATASAFQGYFGKDNFTTFAAALKTANERYAQAAKACRD
jgi:hypothetical protein